MIPKTRLKMQRFDIILVETRRALRTFPTTPRDQLVYALQRDRAGHTHERQFGLQRLVGALHTRPSLFEAHSTYDNDAMLA